MGKAECTVCGAVAEGSNKKEASDKLDHGVGLMKGRPCPNDGTNVILWSGEKETKAPAKAKEAPKEKPKEKTKASGFSLRGKRH